MHNTAPTAPHTFHRAQILANSAYLFPSHPLSTLEVVTTYSRHTDEHTGAHIVSLLSGEVLLSYTDANKIAELRRGLNCVFVDPALYWLYIEVQCLVHEKMVGEGGEGGKGVVEQAAVDVGLLEGELKKVRAELDALRERRERRRRASVSGSQGGSAVRRKVPRFTREQGRLGEGDGSGFLLVEREKE